MSINKAIGFTSAVSPDNIHYELREIELPELGALDVLVKISAVSVNPVDLKMQSVYKGSDFRILGFDAVGRIEALGSEVKKFQVGDRVYYTGQQNRQGSNQLYQAVDSRLIAKVPDGITDFEVAALPLTTITASEILTDSFGLTINENNAVGKSLFIINGAGGVGSILIQLAKFMGMRVLTTASRPDSVGWVKALGADLVFNHREDLDRQLADEGLDKLDYIAILHSTDAYWPFVLKHIAPFGRVSSIVETTGPINLGPLKNIGAQFSWVFMFAKGNYGLRMEEQGAYLEHLSRLIEAGKVGSTVGKVYRGFRLESFEAASREVATGKVIGKVVIDYRY
jgi:zinc-binding alcohol dehydrogenase family protein